MVRFCRPSRIMLGSVTLCCVFIFTLFLRDVFQFFASDFDRGNHSDGNERTLEQFDVLKSEVSSEFTSVLCYY